MDRTLLGWIFVLGLGFPILSLLLGEAAERLDRQEHPLAGAVRKIRRYVLPSLAVLLVMQQLLKFTGTATPVRVVETITWSAAIIAGIVLINALFTTHKPSIKWQLQVPNLLFQVARAAVVLSIGYYVITGVWRIDLSSILTAVGVGSVVIALALQDTLSNLVSGFLLLIAKPFKTGDWIEFNGIEGRVIEQNWWSVRLKSTLGRQFLVPNGTLAKATVNNLEQTPVWKKLSVSFSYDDPPNKVMLALKDVVIGSEVASKPFPIVSSYGDYSINYDLWYLVMPDKNILALAELPQRIYYLAQRHGLTMAYPIAIEYKVDAKQGVPNRIPQVVQNRQREIATYLRSLPYFSKVDDAQIEQLSGQTRVATYGKSEFVTQEGQPDDGLYIVLSGQVRMRLTDEQGNIQELGQLGMGDAFGEMALFPGEVSPVTTIADRDTEVLVIPDEGITHLIQVNPQFASDMIQFIEERKRTVQLAKGVGQESTLIASNGRRMPVQR
ncbi:MAG TPA: mechanosensitive ion channel family protein [Waterburya sp.]|jgi:small-conductance mechanosensitive channel